MKFKFVIFLTMIMGITSSFAENIRYYRNKTEGKRVVQFIFARSVMSARYVEKDNVLRVHYNVGTADFVVKNHDHALEIMNMIGNENNATFIELKLK